MNVTHKSYNPCYMKFLYVNMVRIKLSVSTICLITQYFTLNINILHLVYVCIKWKRGSYDLWDKFMITSRRIIVYGAKKLMNNDIFLVHLHLHLCWYSLTAFPATKGGFVWCLNWRTLVQGAHIYSSCK